MKHELLALALAVSAVGLVGCTSVGVSIGLPLPGMGGVSVGVGSDGRVGGGVVVGTGGVSVGVGGTTRLPRPDDKAPPPADGAASAPPSK
jgi:hypothetical protein